MIVRTFTSTWNMRTKIYAFDDIKVPVKGGITVPQLMAGLVAAVIWVPLALCLGIPSMVGNPGLIAAVLLGPPALVVMKADKPIKHEKTLEEWGGSMLARQGEPKVLAALSGVNAEHHVQLTGSRWVPDGSVDSGRQPWEVGSRQ